jgi:Spy/CpxP family protein refolding chaperone
MKTVTFNFKMVSILTVIIALFFVFEPVSVHAQGGKKQGVKQGQQMGIERGDGMRAFDRAFFAPQLIMRNQNEINLTDSQRENIQKMMNERHAKLTDAQWNIQNEMEKLQNMMDAETVDVSEAMAQLDNVLSLENELKKSQFEMMARIKNELTSEQQSKLSELRGERRNQASAVQRPGKKQQRN